MFIDRDQIGLYNGEKINMIMNAWYSLWRKNEAFSEMLNPLFVSIHLASKEKIGTRTLNYLKKHEPIGCRDLGTTYFLQSKGIKAYFSGCLTLTLGNTYTLPKHLEKENKIYFVDWSLKQNKKIGHYLKQILKSYKNCKISSLTHRYKNRSYFSLEEAESLIKLYAKATLVITQNIHAALPCLSMGVPLILVVPEFDTDRFFGIIDLLNWIGYDANGNFKMVIQFKNQKVCNSTDFIKYKDYLTQLCLAFTHQENIEPKQINWDQINLHQKI